MPEETNPAKASKPLPGSVTGVLAFQLSIHVGLEKGTVGAAWGVGDEAAQAFFAQRFPMAYTMLSSLCRKIEGPMAKPPATPEEDLGPPGGEKPSG